MSAATTIALRIERHDGAHGFEDPAVPGDLTIDEVTRRAVPRLRYPTTDVSTGKPLHYALLHEGRELARDQPVSEAFPRRRARVHVVHEYTNA